MPGDRRRLARHRSRHCGAHTLAAELALLAHAGQPTPEAGQPTPEAGTGDLHDTSLPAVLPGQLDALDLLPTEEA